MSNIINLLDRTKFDFKIFEAAEKVASNLNYEAYVIGGFVRDLLMDRENRRAIV